MQKILFMIELDTAHVLTLARDREEAKRNAHRYLRNVMDDYIVTPLTEIGDSLQIDMSLLS